MVGRVLSIFGVKPDCNLNIMKHGQDLYDVTVRTLTSMREVFRKVKPDVVLVHGYITRL